jgi:hypothetical protein
MRFILIFAFLISSLFGEDVEIDFTEDVEKVAYKSIISFEAGFGSIMRPKVDTVSGENDIKRNMKNLGFKIGAEDIGLRLFLSYRPLIIEDSVAQSFGVELDSMIYLSQKMKFFYGLSAGGMFYEIVDENTTSTYNNSWNNYFGFGTGVVFGVSDHLELELSARYSITNFNNDSVDSSYVFDQILNYYLAINYKF